MKNSVGLHHTPDRSDEIRAEVLQRVASLQKEGKSIQEISELIAAEIQARQDFLKKVDSLNRQSTW